MSLTAGQRMRPHCQPTWSKLPRTGKTPAGGCCQCYAGLGSLPRDPARTGLLPGPGLVAAWRGTAAAASPPSLCQTPAMAGCSECKAQRHEASASQPSTHGECLPLSLQGLETYSTSSRAAQDGNVQGGHIAMLASTTGQGATPAAGKQSSFHAPAPSPTHYACDGCAEYPTNFTHGLTSGQGGSRRHKPSKAADQCCTDNALLIERPPLQRFHTGCVAGVPPPEPLAQQHSAPDWAAPTPCCSARKRCRAGRTSARLQQVSDGQPQQ